MKKSTLIGAALLACAIAAGAYFYTRQENNVNTNVTPEVAKANTTNTTEVKEKPELTPEKIVEQRVKLMRSLQGALNRINTLIWNPMNLDVQVIQNQAEFIRDNAKKMIELYPEGTRTESSKAKPAIWSEWKAFSSMAKNTSDYAQKLIDSLPKQEKDQNAIGDAFPGQNPVGGPEDPLKGLRGIQGHGNHLPSTPSVPGLPSAPNVPQFPKINVPNPMGMNMGLAGASSIRIGPDGAPILPPSIIFSQLTSTCSQCHKKFLDNDTGKEAKQQKP